MLPRVFPVRATANGGDGISAHARAALIAQAETEIDGLREHREGSPASRIHWPSVARGAGMMERKLISEADSRPLVVLDPRAPADEEALDAAVRAAASLTVHFAKRGGCGLLLPGDRRASVVEPDLLAWPLGPRAARARRGHASARRSAPRRTAAGSSSSSPRASSTARRAGSGARRAAACSSSRARSPGDDPCSRSPAATASSPGATGSARRRWPRSGAPREHPRPPPRTQTREGAGGPALPLAPVRARGAARARRVRRAALDADVRSRRAAPGVARRRRSRAA